MTDELDKLKAKYPDDDIRPLNDREKATGNIVTALMYAKKAEFDGEVPQFSQIFYDSGWTVTITNIPETIDD